jgi:hypothetical protein
MHSANRAFEASVMIRGRPVKEVHHRGRTYIEGRSGTEYTLQFRSYERRRVLVIPSVDGLCVIDGKPAGGKSPGFIVEPFAAIEIPGWVVDSGTAAKFEFRPQDARGEKTYVEELQKSGARVDIGNQGLIGFLVFEEHFTPTLNYTGGHMSAKDANIWQGAGFNTDQFSHSNLRGIACSASSVGAVAQSSASLNSMQAPSAPLGTGFGEATDFKTSTGDFKRGRNIGQFVFEYDTLRGLKDRGVPVQFFTGSDKLYGERSAFPADVGIGCKPPSGWRG